MFNENDNKIKAKNIKKYYAPKTAIIYFSESGLTVLDNLSKLIVEQTKFIQIGSEDVTHDVDRLINFTNKNRYNKDFYNWNNDSSKKEDNILKPSTFFSSTNGKKIIDELKTLDLVIMVYKSSQEESLDYVRELSSVLHKHDVFTFHYVIETFVMKEKTQKIYEKLVSYFTKKKQIFVPIAERSIVNAYSQSTISNRNYYINLYVNDLIDSFLSPFLDPSKNSDLFSIVKALFYQDRKNFDSKVITTIGYSDEKNDYIDIALVKALSNPIFYGAFKASQTFLVNIKVPFISENMIKRINYVLKNIIGSNNKFIISSYIGAYDFDVYCQVSIMAININEDKLINNVEQIDEYIKNILLEVSKSNKLSFESEKTKELILENENIGTLNDKIE